MMRSAVLLFGSVVTLLPSAVPARPATLRDAASSRGILVGTSASRTQLAEALFANTAKAEFDLLTAEYEMKLGQLQPNEGSFNWAPADQLVAFAEANAMKVRGHSFVWHKPGNGVPPWLTGKSASQLYEILNNHIASVAKRYGTRVFAWDVANEVFNDDGTLRTSLWYDSPGIGFTGAGYTYVEQAFHWARAAAPHALLFYNDYNIEPLGPKSDALYNMCVDFKNRGVPIDGVGMQMHRTVTGDLSTLAANIKRFTDLGLQVHITEMDIRIPSRDGCTASAADLDAQKQKYEEIVDACLGNAGCTAIQLWGVTDKYTWITGTYPGFGAPLLFDCNYQYKPAYFAVYDRLTYR